MEFTKHLTGYRACCSYENVKKNTKQKINLIIIFFIALLFVLEALSHPMFSLSNSNQFVSDNITSKNG